MSHLTHRTSRWQGQLAGCWTILGPLAMASRRGGQQRQEKWISQAGKCGPRRVGFCYWVETCFMKKSCLMLMLMLLLLLLLLLLWLWLLLLSLLLSLSSQSLPFWTGVLKHADEPNIQNLTEIANMISQFKYSNCGKRFANFQNEQ